MIKFSGINRKKNICIMLSYLIVCPLVFIAGIIDAIAGGGGLITLPAYMIAGLPPHMAIATNKMSSSLGTATATIRYAKEGYIPWKLALVSAVFSLAGSNIGARISLSISDNILKAVMLVLLPATAVFVLKSKVLDVEREQLSNRKTFILSACIALCLGMYDGFYGPGTGTFLLILFTSLVHLKLTEANGVTKVINLASNVSALVVYLASGNTVISLGLAAGVFSIAGNWLGTRLFSKKGAAVAKPVMIIVLAIFFVKVILELAGVL